MAHYNQEWDNLGRNIQNIVDQAVNSRDYQKLNQTIRQVVGHTVDLTGNSVQRQASGDPCVSRTLCDAPDTLYGRTSGKTFAGVFKTLVGIPLSLFAAMGLLGAAISAELLVKDISTVIFLLLMLAAGVWLTYGGIQTMEMVKRFKQYRKVLGFNTQCSVKSLADSVYKKEAFVRRDLQKMIQKGLLREGHLDREKANLITSHETYRYYEQCLQQQAQLKQEAAVDSKSAAGDPQVQEILNRGNAFVAQIRKCNEDIPGEEISEKISRMELIIQRIFERVQTHPEIVSDLKKLMNYYLPMTVKLLRAYADMDAQPIQGETIDGAKREIEASLDTLILAFEKLLDSIFIDTAMDVSSDISVLNTLLAQEGLAEDGLLKK